MKVNKNVTFEYDNFLVIHAVMEKNRISNFSKALNLVLSQVVSQQYSIKRLQDSKDSLMRELEAEKERAESYRKQLHDKSTT